jgi:MFS family permease
MTTRYRIQEDRYRILFGVMFGYFMVQLSLVPVSAMLPTLAAEWQASIGMTGWVMTAYLLCLTSFQLLAGRLGDQISHARVYKLGLWIFAICSVMAGFTNQFWPLIVSRAGQGLGAALLSGNSMAIVHKAFPADERGKAIGWLTIGAAIGSGTGIIVGSLLVQFVSWRWVFWLGVPFAAASLWLLKGDKQQDIRFSWRELDSVGGVFLFLFLVFFSLGFGSHSGHGDTASAASSMIDYRYLGFAVVSFLVLLFVEQKATHPMIYFSQFRNRLFSASVTSNFILHFVMIMIVFFVPFLVQEGLHLTPLHTALVLLSVEVMNALLPLLSNYGYHQRKWTWLRPAGMGWIAFGLIVYLLSVESAGWAGLIGLGMLVGLGMGVYWSINNHVIMASLDDSYRGFASGMLETTRQMGHTLAAGVSAMLMNMHVEDHAHGHVHDALSVLYTGTHSILVVAVITAVLGFLLTFASYYQTHKQVSVSMEDNYGRENNI